MKMERVERKAEDSPKVCPCCGYNLGRLGQTRIGDLLVDGEFGGIYWKGREIDLSPTHRLILFALVRAYPRVITLDALAEAAGCDDTRTPTQNVRIYKNEMVRRFRVADHDFDAVEVVWGVGLRLTTSPPARRDYGGPPRMADPGTLMRRLSSKKGGGFRPIEAD